MGGTQDRNVCRGWNSRVCSPAPPRTVGVTPRDLLGPSGPQLAQMMGANHTADPHRIALRFRENKLRALRILPDRWSALSEAGSDAPRSFPQGWGGLGADSISQPGP